MNLTNNLSTFKLFARDIKLPHSIFALPFVIVGILISPIDHLSLKNMILILICMVSARSFAMGVNRYLDRFYDHLNPRTKNRLLPSKDLSESASLFWILFFGVIFIFGSFFFNSKTGFFSFFLLIFLAF